MTVKASSPDTAGTGGKKWFPGFMKKYRNILIGIVLGLVLLAIFGLTGLFAALLMYSAFRLIRSRLSPKWTQKIAFSLIVICILSVLFALGVILLDIIVKGLPYITWEFLTAPPSNLGRSGGIFPASRFSSTHKQ